MRLNHTSLFNAFLTVFTVIALISCSKKAGYQKDDSIDAKLREEFHKKNDEVIRELKAYNIKELENYFSKELISDPATRREAELVGNRLKTADFELMDEYYAVNKYRDYDTIKTDNKGVGNYFLRYEGFAKEMYIAFFTPKTGDEKWLVTLVFAKLDYGWKLCLMDAAPYTFEGKTAPQLFKEALKKYKKGHNVDAKLTMDLANIALKPSKIWEYAFEEDLRLFDSKITYDVQRAYGFPLVLKQLPTKPRIFAVYVKTVDQGTYPVIQYLTTIPLKEKAEIIEENKHIKTIIGDVFPGINQGRKYVIYSAFNEMTKSTYSVDRYEMADKLN
ncbi:hypothetical protein EOD41_06610 [Mucilaginibacter limnophilus]|uniref:Uncharacterized protein n=1 Tax=Mucilaginibacter limnophilus TaxID=1932778 RepID=A0A3S3TI73_9SPHI|nr:hypothetical protein [Mucilaginibacter limnophilus]RVU01628.1 hypothetical protein EOD41_06610 [Mucilaginibacter limnophilus]